MKNMLLAASLVGGTIAGLILYAQRKNKSGNKISAAAKDAYQIMNNGLGKIERPAHHAMG